MKPITVTVIMATYNRSNYLRAALDSILAQTRAPEEIIVIDDGSTDATAAVLQEYAGEIRVFRQENSGKPAALNSALPRARGSHIWLFDDDDIALPHALAAHVAFLAANRDVDFSFSQNFTFDGGGDIRRRARWRCAPVPDLSEDTLLVALMKRCTLVFQGLLVPARCFEAVGYFDETLLRAEDYDVLLKIARRFSAGDIGQTTFVWRNHEGSRGTANERHAGSARATLFRKYERRIFAAVWKNFSLEEYLPAPARSRGLIGSPRNRARALVQRSDIMFRHDLTAEAAADLQHAIREAVDQGWLLAVAAPVVTRAADVEDPVFAKGACRRARDIARAIRGPRQKQLLPAALKGFYWALLRAVRQGRWTHAGMFVFAIIVFGSSSMRFALLPALPVDPQISR